MNNKILDDAKILAKIIIESSFEYTEEQFYGDWACRYCASNGNRSVWNQCDILHETDCPVLVAEDIMTP